MALHQQQGLEEVGFGDFRFLIRSGSSDIKTLKEVFDQDSYRVQERKRRKPNPFVIEPGERWLDLGAAIGAFSLLAHGLGAHVTAFEPDPDSYSLLCRNLKLNGVKPRELPTHKIAVVADRRKTATFFTNSKTGGHWRNSLVRRIKSSQETVVDCINYDMVLQPAPLCVKMDIEGAEMAILEALRPKHARRIKKMICEYTFDADPSIARYRAIVERLETMFAFVGATRVWERKPDEPEWRWFPFCTMIYCHNIQ